MLPFSQAGRYAPAMSRPKFFLPAPPGTKVLLQTYPGHGDTDYLTSCKMDVYFLGPDGLWSWPTSSVRAMAAGLVHETFDPGGVEIDHGNGWFTTYMHMTSHVPAGTRVKAGEAIGIAGSVGTGVKHLHIEQLFDPSRDGDADTGNMVYPAFVEIITEAPGAKQFESSQPFKLELRKTYTGVSLNGGSAPTEPLSVLEEIMALKIGSPDYIKVRDDFAKAAAEAVWDQRLTLPAEGSNQPITTTARSWLLHANRFAAKASELLKRSGK